MAPPSDKNSKQFTGLRIFCPTKIRFIRYHQRFCGKLESAIHSCFVEGKLFSKLLKIFKKTQVAGSDFNKFLQSPARAKIDIILGTIFHNRQANNCTMSPISIPLNILRICEESQVALYYCTDQFLLLPIQFAETYLEPKRISMIERFCASS